MGQAVTGMLEVRREVACGSGRRRRRDAERPTSLSRHSASRRSLDGRLSSSQPSSARWRTGTEREGEGHRAAVAARSGQLLPFLPVDALRVHCRCGCDKRGRRQCLTFTSSDEQLSRLLVTCMSRESDSSRTPVLRIEPAAAAAVRTIATRHLPSLRLVASNLTPSVISVLSLRGRAVLLSLL